ncbi:hypothetical protein AN403_6002 [Pseudomonas fluorescens]|uniref:Uncharacterized protein n=1 Tax=Pseudomonas fluorescens TaxID=294 RepID=A0A0P8ZWD1_PSEFL|nr:hypothetical protein AN403_6002 [Pseudomonas fluorescens]
MKQHFQLLWLGTRNQSSCLCLCLFLYLFLCL